jgi:hypothetical protein
MKHPLQWNIGIGIWALTLAQLYASITQPPPKSEEEQPPTLNNEQQQSNDWFDKDRWTSNEFTNSCFFVEDICHSTHQWFYDNSNGNGNRNSSTSSHQPFPLKVKLRWEGIESLPKGYPDTLVVDSQIPSNNLTCKYSPIPNHMTLFSYSNHMLGEFYTRALMGLSDIVNAGSNHPNNKFMKQFQTQTQLYLHFEKGTSQVLESHQLFLDLFSNNPILPFRKLLDNTNCRCLKRLIFCGYDVHQRKKKNGTTITTLQPRPSVGIVKHVSDYTSSSNTTRGAKHAVRQLVLQTIVGDNPLMQTRIQEYREYMIMEACKWTRTEYQQHNNNNEGTKDWKIVGLAQRTGRRRWKDLNALQEHCNTKFKAHKIICTTVNIELEEWSNPVNHAIAHGSLDALIGIHGAQLTEAVLMKPGSLVVEFLPWIPEGIKWGSWTAWGHRPTPLGILFTGTDLNHIGYPLRRKHSVDNCNDARKVHDDQYLKRCFGKHIHRWDNRDFQIDEGLLDDVIQRFLMIPPAPPLISCQDFVHKAADNYILYNVNCIPEGETEIKVQHYYKPIDWVDKKQNKTTVAIQQHNFDTMSTINNLEGNRTGLMEFSITMNQNNTTE